MVPVRCGICGSTVAMARSGKWVHTEEIQKDVPLHDARPVESGTLEEMVAKRLDLGAAAHDMLEHHNAIHPASDCEFAKNLMQALKT